MQASNKDDDPNDRLADMLRSVAKAEAARPMPDVPPRLEQWLQNQLPVQTSLWQKWTAFFQSLATPLFMDSEASSPNRRLGLRAGMAGLVGGALLGGGAITLLNRRSVQSQTRTPEWVRAIEQYQSLYVRETVLGSAQSPAQAQAVLLAFTTTATLPTLKVPDLSIQGLSFQRAQRLSFNDIPLLQIVYLPKEGRPLALCAMPAKRLKLENKDSDTHVKTNSAYGMSSAHWQKNDLALVVVADWPIERLQATTDLIQQQV